METRPFGKTGERFPILSLGGEQIVDAHGCTEDEAVEIANAGDHDAMTAAKHGRR